ncbi:MAG TPA: GNAT family N-acetyltransferase [Rhizomicrobium sp.]|nr:GNAT family N-acetyltransferase [Rhizomicrobium sp.]
MAASFERLGWSGKGLSQFERYLREHEAGTRMVFIARTNGAFAGYVTVLWCSVYPPFSEAGIPEISDLNVPPSLRRRGVGSRLMDEAERLIAERSPVAGVGVGLHEDYGAAQRLYVQRGYVPDGRGITSRGNRIAFGERVTVDDDLILWFTKMLPSVNQNTSVGQS